MNPMSRNVLAAAVAAAVALGVTAPAAVAAPKDRSGGVVKVAEPDKGAEKAGKLADKIAKQTEKATAVAGKGAPKVKSKPSARGEKPARLKAGKAGKADRMLAKLQRRLTKEAVKKERYLTRLVASKKVTRLPKAQQTAVISTNISADLSELADLRAAIASGEDLRGVAKDLRTLRPEVYNVILNQLRLAEKLRTELGAVDEPVVEEPATDAPVADEPAGPEPVATVTAEDGSEEPAETSEDPADAADEPAADEPAADEPAADEPADDEASLDSVVAKLLTFNARTTRVELRATQRALSQIKDALEGDTDEDEDAAEDDNAAEDDDADADEDDAAEPVAGTPVISS